MSLVSAQPLSSRTNIRTRSLKVHFKLPVMHKASPTVSVTNANVVRVNTVGSQPGLPPTGILLQGPSQSSVPFPSSPIPCPSRKRAVSVDGYDAYEEGFGDKAPKQVQGTKGSALPFHRRISNIDILRRRSKSCLAASYFHSDSHLARKSRNDSGAPSPSPSDHSQKRKHATRRESMSTGTPSGKIIRQTKRVLADAQFLASVHSSIAFQVQARRCDNDPSRQDECATQDALLVERIWHTLIDMGYKPIQLDSFPAPSPPAAPAQTSPPPKRDPVREAAERAAHRTVATPSTSFAAESAQALPPAPTGPLAVPQLVATLIMRHRDRSTTRPRSAAKKHVARSRDEPLSRSPLSTAALSPTTTIRTASNAADR